MKQWLREWLGIAALELENARLKNLYKDLVSISVDVHFKEPAMILVYSRLKGGQIKEIKADFKNIGELTRFVKSVQSRFNTTQTTWDAPPMYKEAAKEMIARDTV